MNLGAGTSVEARARIRSGAWSGPTSGMAADRVQGNVVILPRELSADDIQNAEVAVF
jgi:uncharacterized protein YcsI (UPF0317 family)